MVLGRTMCCNVTWKTIHIDFFFLKKKEEPMSELVVWCWENIVAKTQMLPHWQCRTKKHKC